MRFERFFPVLAAIGLWTAACGAPRLRPENEISLSFPLVEASRVNCRSPLMPAITAGPGGLVLVETRNGYLQALDPEQATIRWSIFLGAAASEPVVVGDRIVWAISNGWIFGLDEAGQEAWRLEINEPVFGELRVVGGRVVFLNEKDFLTALNPADGAIVWRIPVPSAAKWTADGERIILRTSDNRLRIFESDGRPTGDFAIEGKAAGDFGIVDNFAVLGFADGRLAAYDLTTGEKRWSQHLGGVPVGPPVSDGRNIYVVLSSQIVAALQLKRGELLWWKALSGRAAFSPRLIGSYALVSSRSPRLQAFLAKDGEAEVAFEAGGEILAPPEMIGSKILLVINAETEDQDVFVSLHASPPAPPESPEKTDATEIKK
ncbi:MAG: PQQ-like beta-propeller repeat protein [Candidatus Aminicenantes bacterium]|nr:PQQ-like beta-propeller repeat protein [Candidatus Aminicenantes bacterium]